jgi:hypothetical protein
MTAIAIATQEVTYTTPLVTTLSVTATISAVDLAKSYVFQQASTMGRNLCSNCAAGPTGPKGTTDNNFIGLFAHELFDTVTVRSFRPPVTMGGQAVAD